MFQEIQPSTQLCRSDAVIDRMQMPLRLRPFALPLVLQAARAVAGHSGNPVAFLPLGQLPSYVGHRQEASPEPFDA